MRGIICFAVILALAGMAFAVLPRQNNIPPIEIEYPEAVPGDKNIVAELGLQSIQKLTVDSIAGNVRSLICTPLPTDISVRTASGAETAANAFILRYPSLFKIPADELEIERAEKILRHWYVTLRHKVGNYDVLHSSVELRINEAGEIFLFRSKLKPFAKVSLLDNIGSSGAIEIALSYVEPQTYKLLNSELMIAPVPSENHYEGKLVWWLRIQTKNPLGLWIMWVDASTGEIIRALDELPTVSGNIYCENVPHYSDDTPENGPFRDGYVLIDASSGYTDEFGAFTDLGAMTEDHNLFSELRGRYCDIVDPDYDEGQTYVPFSGDWYEYTWTTPEFRKDQLNLYYHANFIHTWYVHTFDFHELDYTMPCRVNDPYMDDNAYWDGEGINFGHGGGYMVNLALISDVIYHEYTHGVTHFIYPEWMLPYEGQSGAIDEALSDYFPCTIFDDYRMGEGSYAGAPTTPMRVLQNTNRYPEDFIDEVHYDGQIIAGAWWDIRTILGAGYTDTLVHYARYGYPEEFEEYLEEVLVVDDDDGNLLNGTPNATVIYPCFSNHGIGPSILLEITHDPLASTEDSLNPYPVDANVMSYFGVDTAYVYYRILGDFEWYPVLMTNISGSDWRGAIPAQSLGTTVYYYISIVDIIGNVRTYPSTAPSNFFTFAVETDTLAPEIEHYPLTRGCFPSWSPTVFAIVSDNGAVGSATIRYKVNDALHRDVAMVYDEERDGWVGIFDYEEIAIYDEVAYQIQATDISAGANLAIYPAEDVYIEFFVEKHYFEDVETGGCDYAMYSIETDFIDQWHVSDARAYLGASSFKCGGAGTGDHDDSVDGALETPSIYVTSTDSLMFYHRMDAETSSSYEGYAWDGGIVEMSIDGGVSWEQITPVDGYPFRIMYNLASPFPVDTWCFSGRYSWEQEVFLLDYNGYAKFRFHFGSDAYQTYEGWYIDNIRVSNTWSSIFEDGIWKPDKFALKISPNPFNGAVSIATAMPVDGKLSIEIFDISGHLVENIYDSNTRVGVFTIRWQPDEIPAGIYFARARTGENSITRKIFFIK